MAGSHPKPPPSERDIARAARDNELRQLTAEYGAPAAKAIQKLGDIASSSPEPTTRALAHDKIDLIKEAHSGSVPELERGAHRPALTQARSHGRTLDFER